MTLGRSEDDYLSATPRMLVAALERYREQREAEQQMLDLRAGKIVAAVYNSIPGGRRVWKPRDFFPSLMPTREGAQSAAEMLAAVEAHNAVLGGRDLRQRTH